MDREVRADVVDVLVRYATGIDRRDWPLFRSCFTSDCDADYGAIGRWHGVDEITAFMERTHAGCGHTLHRITNEAVASNGEDASARSYVDAIIFGADNQNGVRAVGYYDDDFTRTDDGWKIARRHFTMVHTQIITAEG